jgi:D-proline reductase (dithiol) PrdB
MGEISEFSFSVRLFVKTYKWRRIDPTPWTSVSKPLSESRVAVVSSAGFVLPDQEPFDQKMKGGDPSYRLIPADTDVATLIDAHRSESFDHTGMDQDPNLVFPLDRMREMVESGRIGELAPRHPSMMGSITAPGRMIKQTAPQAASDLVEDQVDVALLIPV